MKQSYNNNSLAFLGHGKWKSALRHTLLIIGMVLMSMGVYAQEATGGLYMNKSWHPTSPNGDKGYIQLETFVTGETTVVNVSVPTDIVVVVDQSGSMDYDFDGNETNVEANKRITALKNALNTFVSTVVNDAASNGCKHKIAIVGFAAGNYNHNSQTYYNTELLTPSEINYSSIEISNYQNALIQANTGTGTQGVVNTILTDAISNITADGGTSMELGLEMAYNILNNRTETTFTDENNIVHDRSQVVVFFTDGYPGRYSMPYSNMSYPFNQDWMCEGYFRNRQDGSATFDQKTVADAAVSQANSIKNLGASVFSVGIFTGADPAVAYRTTQGNYTNNSSNGTYWNTGKAGANGLLHFISSNYAKDEATSWSGLTTNSNNATPGYKNNGFYMSASNASQLQNVFSQIAEQSGGAQIEMGTQTVVQDVISADFTFDIPDGATLDNTIKAYLPLCTGAVDEHNTPTQWEEDETNLLFADLSEGELSINNDGTVTGGTGHENKLPDGTVDIDENTKTLSLTGVNFDNMWCGREEYEAQGQTKIRPHGRKLVIIIPLVIDGNTWGDGIETNGPMSVVFPNGDQLTPIEFNIPVADVVGEVWTEVVTDEPDGFDPMNIDSPEDLAWFISVVNGRKGYEKNPNVAPAPSTNAKLTADIDMSAHNWVPIGMNTIKGTDGVTVVSYTGIFDGNGHVITGLKNNAGKKFMEGDVSWVFPGMFNKVGNGGVVKNVFVLDADFRGQQRMSGNKMMFVHHGIIVDSLLVGGQVFNCEAAGRITCKNDENAANLKFGGLVGLNQGTIHSCMAMAELTGYTMGGMIGENQGSFYNGFTNGVYHYVGESGTNAKPVGGIAAINTTADNIKNCYVRFSRDENEGLNDANFGRIVGTGGSFTTTSCYSPMYAIMNNDGTMGAYPGNAPMEGHGIQYSTTCAPSLMREAHSNDNMVSDDSDWPTWSSITYSNGTIVPLLNGGTPLLDKLNAGKDDGASWKRTTAGGYATSPNGGNINDDYPILEFTDFNCVASADGIRLDYAASLDEMLDRHNAGNMNVGTAMPSTTATWYTAPELATTYTVTASPAIYGGAINLYANDDNVKESTSTTAKTMVYIDENVSLLQGNTTSSLDAYTCQTLKSFSTSWPGDGTGERWHDISSSLTGSKFGWTYGNNGTVNHNWDPNPCEWWLETLNDDEAIIPTDAKSYAVADFYCFYEPQYHWINFRRNSSSHWHMDNYSSNIEYTNETEFQRGKGYLMALSTEYFDDHYKAAAGNKHEQFLQNRGTLNNGNIEIEVTASAPEWTGLKGYNLLGNPYQSFLDFDAFVAGNSGDPEDPDDTGLWATGDTFAQTYAVYNPESGMHEQYKATSSTGSRAAGQYLNMHQGFFIQTSKNTTAYFTNGMRVNDATPCFRGEQPAYPLINFILTDNEGNTDLAILELNRPENDGAKKLHVGNPAGRIYFRYDNTNLAIYFRNSDKDYQSLNFAAEEDGNFTLSWERANDNFRTLTLVDNVTGIKTDMLTHDHYTFEGRVSDYNSRFKIVFGEMDIDEEEPVLEHFAFFDHGNLIVNGTGHFEVVDVLGRVVYNAELTDTQNTVSLPSNVRGVCMLCFTRNNETKVQKMVIQ